MLLWIGCGNTTAPPSELATVVESQDSIVSENGELALTRGTLAIESIWLKGVGGEPQLLGPVTLDLAVVEQDLFLHMDIPPGEYTGLRIELAPSGEGGETLDVDVQSTVTQAAVRVTSRLTISGETYFPEGPRDIAEDSELELRISLRGMFFYLAPISDGVDGRYELDEENGANFLTMDLINMFDLRVLR
ncbi:MAG: hypothetical protein WCE62_01705 [Polyangiales bacterium]